MHTINKIDREQPPVARITDRKQSDFGVERPRGIEPVAADAFGRGVRRGEAGSTAASRAATAASMTPRWNRSRYPGSGGGTTGSPSQASSSLVTGPEWVCVR